MDHPQQRVPREPGRRRIPRAVWDAVVEARRLMERSEADCRALRERCDAELDAARAAARAAGREEGLASVTELLARAGRAHDAALAGAERDLVELAFAVARRVLAREFERDRGAVVEIAARALAAARRRVEVAVRVNPADVEVLRAAEPRLLEQLSRARGLRLVGDASIDPGGAVVETEAGVVDARLATQLEGLRRALEDPS